MKPSLQLRLSQHLALTPQLQQSIRLLQLSTLELQQEVEQMLEANPFLDAEEELTVGPPTALPERASADGQAEMDETDGRTGGDEPAGIDRAEAGATERDDWENGTESDDFDGIRETPSGAGGAMGEGDDLDPQDRNAAHVTLRDHLRDQLRGLRLPPEDAAAVLVLIESLNEDGYLADPLEEIADRLFPELGLSDDPLTAEDEREELLGRLRCALKWLQSMEPTGVGARDLADCLALQVAARPACAAQPVALQICRRHLDLLARRDLKKLMAATAADEVLVKTAIGLITACEPKPGRQFADAESLVIVPDVIVQRGSRGWKAVLNPDVMPKLRVNDLYAQALRGTKGSSGTPLAARLQEARWFIRNIQQRFDTILRVSQAIVGRQKNFFTHGEIAMKPLVLREIADELGLHESTISRVTTAKYMATPFGTFELKYFFGSSLNTDAGGNASSTAVRALIRQFVAAETAANPLSDSQISKMLEEQGIQVARRTVAKYREALKIAPANLRKSM
jgi:RNA polymerase sigma-54 factor